MDSLGKLLDMNGFKALDIVDKSVDNKKNDYKNKQIIQTVKKPKILRINLNEGILEGNLIEMPFISYSLDRRKKDIVTVVEYKWVDSKGAERGLEVRGSGKYGVPTSFEFDVLIALLRTYAKSEKILLNRQYEDANISEDDVTIDFTLTQLAREMGVEKPNSTMLNKILRSIEILTDTTIYNRYSGGLYDIAQKKYMEDKTVAYHIIEKFESTLYRDGGKRKRGQDVCQKVKLNQFFYKSIAGNYFKFYDHTEYVAINTNVGRRLFLIFNKWRDNKDFLRFKCETLYQRIPLETSISISRKNQTLKRALESLVESKFIESFKFEKEFVTAYFKAQNLIENPQNMYFKNKYNNHKEILDRLYEIKMTDDEIQKHTSVITFDNDYVKALLRYADINEDYGNIDNIKGFIISGLTSKFNIDQKYYN